MRGSTNSCVSPSRLSIFELRIEAMRNSPREFVTVGDYAGPDRRRRETAGAPAAPRRGRRLNPARPPLRIPGMRVDLLPAMAGDQPSIAGGLERRALFGT